MHRERDEVAEKLQRRTEKEEANEYKRTRIKAGKKREGEKGKSEELSERTAKRKSAVVRARISQKKRGPRTRFSTIKSARRGSSACTRARARERGLSFPLYKRQRREKKADFFHSAGKLFSYNKIAARNSKVNFSCRARAEKGEKVRAGRAPREDKY